MRVAIGGIAHESSTFATVPTTLDDFVQRGYQEDEALIEELTGTNRVAAASSTRPGRWASRSFQPSWPPPSQPGRSRPRQPRP